MNINSPVNGYLNYPITSFPTPLVLQPRTANNQGSWRYAMSNVLPKITSTEKYCIQCAILDSGASSHFILAEDLCVFNTPMSIPITLHPSNRQTVTSSHTCKLAFLHLPQKACVAHIMPGLTNRSLISMVKLCNAGCNTNVPGISCNIIMTCL